MAEYFDRGHAGALGHARLRREAGSQLLELEPVGDWSLEEWSLERRRGCLEKALSYPPLGVVALRAVDEV